MKIKTSVTLSEDIINILDHFKNDFKNRSDAIEKAVRYFFQQKKRELREENDLKILNKRTKRLNKEALDVLGYQVDL